MFWENGKLWEIWSILSAHRPQGLAGVGRIDINALMGLAEQYDLSFEEFQRVLILESILYPLIMKKMETEHGGSKNKD